MSEQAAVIAESSPVEAPIMEASRGPLVNLSPEQRAEYKTTGELPKPQKEASAPSSEPKPEKVEAKPAGDSDTPKESQEKPKVEPKPKKDQTAEERIAQLESTIDKIRKDAGLSKTEKVVESSPAKPESKPQQPQATRPKPTADDKNTDGTPKFKTYEDFVEDLSDWKAEQRDATNKREQAQKADAERFSAMVDKGRSRYENFDAIVEPAAKAIYNDPQISPIVKRMLSKSDLLADFVYTVGGNDKELSNFIKMSREEEPDGAVEYIALTLALIREELAGKSEPAKVEETPVKPKTNAPRPPADVGGRAAAPPDSLQAALEGSGGKLTAGVKAEFTRRALAKLKS